MNRIKILACALAAALPLAVAAQELDKTIVLDKDFRPVEKKVTKKSALPKVLKPVHSTEGSNISYSTWAQPTAVSTEIPTMLPYGYRTSHIFSDKRGYLDLGGGTQANLVGSLGYRIADDDNLKVDAWLQHSSSWAGKNQTPVITDDALRLKQKFNDNVIGLDANVLTGPGSLKLGAKLHLDNFNYYGGTGTWWDDNKQTLVDALIGGRWDGKATVSDHDISYHATAQLNYAGYSKSFTDLYKGSQDLYPHFDLGLTFALDQTQRVGLNAYFDIMSRTKRPDAGDNLKRTTSTITLSPFYSFNTEHLSAQLGANVAFNHNDGPSVRFTPNVSVSLEASPGFTVYGKAIGRKYFNSISSMATLSRYSDPLANYRNTACVVDAEAGFKVGPFSGFTAQLHVGYGAYNNRLMPYLPQSAYLPAGADVATGTVPITAEMRYAPVYYVPLRTRGWNVGAEVTYKYRSLLEVLLKGAYAPQEDKVEGSKYKSYQLGLDNAKWTATAEVKAYPIKALSLNLGIELRGDRRVLEADGINVNAANEWTYKFLDLEDVTNLFAGASYRFDRNITIWAKAANLLGKRTDVLYGQGAQKVSVMAGVGFVF